MADLTDQTSDDVYDDPDNILADTDDGVEGSIELTDNQKASESQSIFKPELEGDDRGPITELEEPDDSDETVDLEQTHPEDVDTDSGKLSDADPNEAQDGSEG